jgi:signal transduction histidine kinase
MTIDSQSITDLPSLLVRQRLSGSAEGYVRLCREIAEGLGLPYVGLRLKDGGPEFGPDAEFRWPTRGRPGRWIRARYRTLPVFRGGQQLAALTLPNERWRRLDGEKQRTLDDVLDLLGAVLDLARLAAERQAAITRARNQAERIAVVRRRAFAERDQERKDLERDLHDGAQHHLVALRMAVGVLAVHLGYRDLPAARAQLARLRSGIVQAEQVLFSTAAGGFPAGLVEQGFVAALAAELNSGPQVNLISELPPARRYPLTIETAVYFVCLEAVNNARKHAPGADIRVRLSEGPVGLRFTVTDNGPGLGPTDGMASFGLGSIRRRIEAAGGRLDLITVPGAGTTVTGVIPPPFLD